VSRFLKTVGTVAMVLGLIVALPGLLLLIVAAQIGGVLVDRDHATHDAALYPADLAPDSEPR
jgi:hypothetical protein